MNDKVVGAILLSAAGLVAAIGAVGSQIALAIVQGQFFVSKMPGGVPGPEQVTLHPAVIIAALGLAAAGLFLLFRPSKQK